MSSVDIILDKLQRLDACTKNLIALGCKVTAVYANTTDAPPVVQIDTCSQSLVQHLDCTPIWAFIDNQWRVGSCFMDGCAITWRQQAPRHEVELAA